MNRSSLLLSCAALALFLAGSPPAAGGTPDLRIKVTNKSLGFNKSRESKTSQRQLRILIDNREREDLNGLTLEWSVLARDINSRKYSLAASGTKTVNLAAEEETEITSDPVPFTKKEGKVKVQHNRNNHQFDRIKADPDTGTRYAGYVVVIRQDGEIVAEAATGGMKRRLEKLRAGRKKK